MKVVQLAVCRRGLVASQPVDALVLTADGVTGDRHAGPTLKAGPRQKGVPRGTVLPNTRQVSLVSVEESALVAQRLGAPRLAMEWLAANVELSDAARLTSLPEGTRLEFDGGCVVTLAGENEPGGKVGKVIAEALERPELASRFAKAAWGLRGVVGFVTTPGTIARGANVRVR